MSYISVHDLVPGKSYVPVGSHGFDYERAGTFVKKSANPNTATLQWKGEKHVFGSTDYFVEAVKDSNGKLVAKQGGGKRRKTLRKKRRSTRR